MKMVLKKTIAYVLKVESELVLWKYKPKVIAITGSVGKTSTKDAVYAVISKFAHVRKSEKSYNSEIGLPLTILGCPNGWNDPFVWLFNFLRGLWLIIWPHKYPKWLVLEVGVGKPGDMQKTTSFIKTDAVIITGIGDTPAHIEFFNSREHLIEEKSGLIKTLKKEGILVLNADDEAVLKMKSKTKNIVTTYGFKEGADLEGGGENILYDDSGLPGGIVFRVEDGGLARGSMAKGSSLPVVIEGVFGRNHIYASLAALALAKNLKFNLLEAINALRNFDVPPGRMRLLRGINETLIIDDTYNSSPFACKSALETLGEVKTDGRKIAVLGDMLELGKHTIEAHEDVGGVAKKNVDVLVVVGPRAVSIKVGAVEAKMKPKNIYEFSNSREAGEFLKTFIEKGDLVLIKGSQGMRMERAVEAILTDQKNKSDLLVRQDEEWQKKQ
jgi:UDP-N-acetylmuramoyl-tripeptide--D-alanyl-D-alanine ligase